MATTKRVRRHARALHGVEICSTRWQILVWGYVMLPGKGEGFANEQAERECWQAHSEQLMAEKRSAGVRPHGYFKFELGVKPEFWFEELGALLDRGLIDAEEARQIESYRPMLAPGAEAFCRGYESIASMPRTHVVEPRSVDEFDFAARWHTWRGRPDLAATFQRRAQNVREYFTRREPQK